MKREIPILRTDDDGLMETEAKPRLFILGASARAAAFSALRAGLVPTCADLFADLDLMAHAQAVRVDGGNYPYSLKQPVLDAEPSPWMYTGGLENCPDLIAAIARSGGPERPLWGNNAAVLRAIRDPFRLAACLEQAGLPHPRCLPLGSKRPRGERWLLKPRGRAGGSGISESARTPKLADAQQWYWQQYVEGLPCSAVYVGGAAGARLLGATRQLVGDSRFGAKRFAYCGSIGPLAPESSLKQQLESLGTVLAGKFRLRGIFGVDFILADGAAWPVEVNPRYPASLEVLEHALGIAALELHRVAFDASAPPAAPPPPGEPKEQVGKAILFAKRTVRLPDTRRWLDTSAWSRLPTIADIPRPGASITAGRPILTVFARADSAEACYLALIERTLRVESQLK